MSSYLARRSFWKLALGIAVLGLAVPSATAPACDTPVYRYAMYNWPSAPYRVFYFHHGDPSKADQAINELIDKQSEATPAPANILVSTVDLSKTQIDKLPQPVTEAFKAYKDGEPSHLVFTPWGVSIYSGKLDKATIDAMVDSPARAKLGKLLDDGNVAVFLMLPGADAKENARAEAAVKKLIARGAAGEIPVGAVFAMPPAAGPNGEPPDDKAIAAANQVKLALLKVDRSTPAEKWLVRSLMTIEPDLKDLADEPMVFTVYGRARALEPYVGKGITADNLADVVMFVSDACSCQVKDMNPGADLLLKWDWETTADKLAASDPEYSMAGYTPYGYGEYPAAPADEEATSSTEAETVAMSDDAPAAPTAATEGAVAASPSEPPAASPEKPAESPETSAETPQAPDTPPAAEPAPAEPQAKVSSDSSAVFASPAPTAEETTPVAAEAPPLAAGSESFASRQLWKYGVGLVIGAVVVLGAGFVLLRKQSA